MNSEHKKNGFSFLELLMVFSLLSILSLMLIPSVHKMKEKGRQAQCIGNQRQLAVAALLYANESINVLPVNIASINNGPYIQPDYEDSSGFFESNAYADINVAMFYNNDFRVTQCPEVEGSLKDMNPIHSYGMNIYITGMKIDLIENAATTVMITDSYFAAISKNDEVSFRHGVNDAIAAYVDGHIELFRAIIPPSKFTPRNDTDDDFIVDDETINNDNPQPQPDPEPEPQDETEQPTEEEQPSTPVEKTYPPILDSNGFAMDVKTITEGEETTIKIIMASGENKKALSHVSYTFSLPLPADVLQQALTSAQSTFNYPVVIVNPDPQTGFVGIKFDETSLGEDQVVEVCEFSFKIPSSSVTSAGDFTISTKAGTKISSSSLQLE